MSTPAGGVPVGWQLSVEELVALSDVVTGHVGYPEIDAWWADLDGGQRAASYELGLEALGARGEDVGLRDAVQVRRNAVGVLMAEPNAGDVLAANVAADGRVTLERVREDRGLDLLLSDIDGAVEVLVGALGAGLGGRLQAVPLPQPAPVVTVAVMPANGTWSWLTADAEFDLTPEEMTGAVRLLAQALAAGAPHPAPAPTTR